MAMSEPPAWTQQRIDRMKQQYPEFSVVDPNMYIQSDLKASQNTNTPLTDYTLSVLSLARYAKRKPNE